MAEVHVPKIVQAQVHQEGTRVQVAVNGSLALDLPWDSALEIGKAIIVKARQAEELAKVAAIVSDQALLMRAGLPIGLTARPDMMKEAAKEAAWGRELRRAIPFGNIESAEKFGVPSIKQGPPKK